MSRVVVVSNRVAIPSGRSLPGAQGGLAGALDAALRTTKGLWFGWSGEERDVPSGTPYVQDHGGITFATLDLSPQDLEEYYNGYANSTLWPLFHYRIDLAEYDRETGKGYERGNELFARVLSG